MIYKHVIVPYNNIGQYHLTIPKDIVELEGWTKGQEIKLKKDCHKELGLYSTYTS